MLFDRAQNLKSIAMKMFGFDRNLIVCIWFFTLCCKQTASECTQLTPCSCMFSNGEGYNLSPLQKLSPLQVTSENHTFYFHPCTNSPLSNVTNSECNLNKGVSLCVQQGNETHSLGTVEETSIEGGTNKVLPSLILRHGKNTTTIDLFCCDSCNSHLIRDPDVKNVARCDINRYAKRRLPILSWLTTYKLPWLPQDALAGFTVGLTAIPQGIAYGVVAGLSPEYGLYASFMASFVYIVFGSCKSITIGPTAIMATMVQPLVVAYGPDIAVLLTFLKGCMIALLGLFHLGFLLSFISLPVITGFTAAASINIAASQFKSLLGIPGRSEDLVDALDAIFSNLEKIRYQDTLLGVVTIAVLVLFKHLPGRRTGNWIQKIAWVVTLARNAIVVVVGTALAYIFFVNEQTPFVLTGTLGEGLPPFGPPPFSIIANNRTYDFIETTTAMGTTLFFVPVVSAIEHMAIAKAFAMGKSLDATQEMLALGLCNMFGSFVRSMPVTGSFTRTAVNHSSGVKTTFGGLFTGCLVLLASSLLTSTFRFIPKATLAAVIICAMYYMLDFKTYALLWRARSKLTDTLSGLFLDVDYVPVLRFSQTRMGNPYRNSFESGNIAVLLDAIYRSNRSRTDRG
nr:PREDICTED: sodium-independent sulfate anion transporter-like isoform X4 [Megachile rotundata]